MEPQVRDVAIAEGAALERLGEGTLEIGLDPRADGDGALIVASGWLTRLARRALPGARPGPQEPPWMRS